MRVHVKTSCPQFECYSPTHKLVRMNDPFSLGGYTFEFDRSEYHRVSESFVFRFRVPKADSPSLMVCHNPDNQDTPYAMRLTYNPTKRFNQQDTDEDISGWDSDDETDMIQEEEPLNVAAPTNFIFVIDRSGSMDGKPMKMANEALVILLKSLNEGSTFNIVSFGTNYEFMSQGGSMPVT